jgi:hypothetical protein
MLTSADEGLVYIQAFLQGQLSDSTDFAKWNGADSILARNEPTEADRAGRPYCVFSLRSDESADEWGHSARRAQVLAECKATDSNGGRIGEANEVGSQKLLSDALIAAIEDNYNTFNEAGLWGIEVAGPVERIDAPSGYPVYVSSHTITFFYER